MKYLYVDNFRGFTNTLIPLKDVNFLVGENSTGKTSILALLNIISNPCFWFRQEFYNEEIELGMFEDIVSITSKDNNYFKVGLINNNNKIKDNDITLLMKFMNRDGNPILSEYSFIKNKHEMHIYFTKNDKVRYKIEPINNKSVSAKDILNIFNKWLSKKEKKGYKELKNIPFPRKMALINSLDLMNKLINNKRGSKEKSTISMSYPMFLDYFGSLGWIAPIRTTAKRTYDKYKIDFKPEGDHAPYLIKTLLSKVRSKEKFSKFINEFGGNSNLFSDIGVEKFGKRAESPFKLNVYLKDKPLNIVNVGYGVSQCLPVIVELFARSQSTWYAIQQPEVHLHPKAQAALGDVFYSFAEKEKKKFIIETHSDYTIDRFRLQYKHKKNGINAQVLFFCRDKNGNKIYPIDIENDGKYSKNQPKSFRKFFIREKMELLDL